MSQADLEKWDVRYREGSYMARDYPSPFLDEWLERLPPAVFNGRALDIACGAGRNALRLAQADLCVDAMDISGGARSRSSERERTWIECELDTGGSG